MNPFVTSFFVLCKNDYTFSIYIQRGKGDGMSKISQAIDGKSFIIGVLVIVVVSLSMDAKNQIAWNSKQEWEVLSKKIISDVEKEVSEATGDRPPEVDVEGYEPFAVIIRPSHSPEVWYRKPVN